MKRTQIAGRMIWGAMLAFALAGCYQSAGDAVEPTTVDVVSLDAITTPTALVPVDLSPTAFITPLPSEGYIPPTDTPSVPPTPTESIAPTEIPVTTVPTTAPVVDIPPSAIPPIVPTTEPAAINAVTPTPTLSIPDPAALATPTSFPTTDAVLATPTAFATANPCVHTVQPGEWMNKIAQKYSVPLDILVAANRQLPNVNALQVGDQVNIPNCTANGATPNAASAAVVVPPTATVVAVQGAGVPTAILVSEQETQTYTVVSGDTLGGIAAKFNTTTDELIKMNNVLNPNTLAIGDQIKVPRAK